MDNRRFWGVAAIIIGAVALLDRVERFMPQLVQIGEHFWPLFLIAIGVMVIIKAPKVVWLGLGVILVLGLFVADVSWSIDGFWETNQERGVSHQVRKSSDGVQALDVQLNLGAAEIKIDSFPQGLYEIDFHGSTKPTTNYSISDGIGRLVINQRTDLLPNSKPVWKLNLSELVPLSLSINSGAGEMDFDLQDNLVENLSIQAGAEQIDLNLGDRLSYSQLDFNVAASKININVPKEARVQLRTSSPLISTSLEKQDAWVSQEGSLNYSGSPKGPFFEISVNSVAAKINVSFS